MPDSPADRPSAHPTPPARVGASGLDLDTVDKLLATTRAVRRRMDFTRPVPAEVLLECLELAIQAPTGSNSQSWRWLVVTNPLVRAGLADLYQHPVIPTGTTFHEVPDSEQQRRVNASARYLTEHIGEVPALVVPCTRDAGGAAGWPPSIYPAVWSLMLALRSRGLGSVITTSHLYRRDEAAALLGIPDGFVQSCLVPVAYFTGDDFKPADRLPVAEVTYWDRWGEAPPSR
ncbi:MAG TPA: nitroreductase family protein [Acidimicrobiales bacterium]